MTAAKKKARPPLDCCRQWTDVAATQREQWPWQVLHRFGHSRTAFSAETLAETARIPVEQALELVRNGELRKWIWTPQAGVWVGRLPSRR
jgi:hypothetical protein